jgi:MFS family permease
LTSLYFGVVTLGNLLTTAIVNRVGARRMVRASVTLLFLGIGIAALAHTLPLLFLAQLCIGLSMGVGYPVLMGMSIQQIDDRERTTAMGLHQSVYAVGMFGGPLLSGVLADAMGIRPMFWITAFVCLVAGLFVAGKLGDPVKTQGR